MNYMFVRSLKHRIFFFFYLLDTLWRAEIQGRFSASYLGSSLRNKGSLCPGVENMPKVQVTTFPLNVQLCYIFKLYIFFSEVPPSVEYFVVISLYDFSKCLCMIISVYLSMFLY